jgi:hypothetical protein
VKQKVHRITSHGNREREKRHSSTLSLTVALDESDVVRIGERRGVYRVLVGKPEGKRQLGRPRRGWEDNV